MMPWHVQCYPTVNWCTLLKFTLEKYITINPSITMPCQPSNENIPVNYTLRQVRIHASVSQASTGSGSGSLPVRRRPIIFTNYCWLDHWWLFITTFRTRKLIPKHCLHFSDDNDHDYHSIWFNQVSCPILDHSVGWLHDWIWCLF